MPKARTCFLLCAALLLSSAVLGKGTYLTVDEFLSSAFGELSPARQKLWLNASQRKSLEGILGHPVGLRVSYWRAEKRSAWVLDEIGKELPITIGVVIEGDALLDVRILAFRESRGGEVRYPFFTRQFIGLKLQSETFRLNDSIDGISGATMSVNAVTRASTAALFMHQQLSSDLP